MKIIEFYKRNFEGAIRQFDPAWEADDSYHMGYRWVKRSFPFTEYFQITDLKGDSPALLFSMHLPDSYMQTTIFEEVRNYKSNYEISIILLDRALRINAVNAADSLQESLMGFIHKAKGDFMNVMDWAIQRTSRQE